MKKILYVATVDIHIRSFHLPYLKMLHENGYEVHVATNGDEQFPYCDVKHTICIERSPFKIKNLKAIKQLKKIIEKEKYNIVHCHTPMGSVVARLASIKARKKYGTRVIYTCHGFHFYKGAPKISWLLFYPIEKWLAKYTDTLITINKEDYQLAKNKFSKRCNDIHYIPGIGIDTKKFNFEMTKEEKRKLRKSIGLQQNDIVLTCVARLDKNKNQGFLINCMEILSKKNNHIHLLLVGKDELNGFYQKMTKEKKIENNVHFLGQRNDIPQLLSITDIVVSASKREGLPVNVMEAFCSGLPVVALNCRGMRDLIKNGKNGYIVNSEQEFVDKIKLLINNKKLVNVISDTNAKKSLKYDIDNILKKAKKILKKEKIKVLHLLSSNTYSGAENVACMIIDNLQKKYNMVYCSPNGEIKHKLSEFDIKYISLKKLSYFEIKRALIKYNPDIIHAHDFRASCYAALFYKKYKVISHIHGNNKIMNKLNVKSYIYKMISNKFYKIIWVSDSSLNDYYYRKKVMKNSLVMYNVIDSESVIKKSNEWNCSNNYDLIFLGRLAYPKNPERLIEIINLVKQEKNDIQVAIVGDGVDKEKVIKKIQDYNLDNNIVLYGFQKNPYPILKNSKILIMTSIYEGTPMSALEAQCLGKPIIATPVDGLKKIIKNDINGFLSDDDEILAKKIIELLNNNDKLTKMSNKSIEKNNRNFNLNNYIKKIELIYKKH